MLLFGIWEIDNEVSDTVVDMAKNYKSRIWNISSQYFKIPVYIKNETNSSLQPLTDCAELHSLPSSLVQWREHINNTIMMGYPTQRSPWLLRFRAKAPDSLALPHMKMQRMCNEAHCDGIWCEGKHDWFAVKMKHVPLNNSQCSHCVVKSFSHVGTSLQTFVWLDGKCTSSLSFVW